MFGKLLTLSKIHSVVCLMLMLGMMAIMGRPTQVMAADNVLPNPGFEEGIKDWSIGEGDSLVTEEAARRRREASVAPTRALEACAVRPTGASVGVAEARS